MIKTEEPIQDVKGTNVVECQFGWIEYEDKDILFFPDGLYGYDQYHHYLVYTQKEFLPFQWLICLDDPYLMFPVIDPKIVCPNYHPKFKGTKSTGSLLAIVTMGSTMESVTINLRAPIRVFKASRKAKQEILTDTQYPLKYHVLRSSN